METDALKLRACVSAATKLDIALAGRWLCRSRCAGWRAERSWCGDLGVFRVQQVGTGFLNISRCWAGAPVQRDLSSSRRGAAQQQPPRAATSQISAASQPTAANWPMLSRIRAFQHGEPMAMTANYNKCSYFSGIRAPCPRCPGPFLPIPSLPAHNPHACALSRRTPGLGYRSLDRQGSGGQCPQSSTTAAPVMARHPTQSPLPE
jgi:hypothetical protein